MILEQENLSLFVPSPLKMKSVSEISLGVIFPLQSPSASLLCSFENSVPGKERTTAPTRKGTSEVETGSIRQSGSRKPLPAGRKGQQRERERGMEVQSQGADSPAGKALGLGASSPPRVPWVHAELSESHGQCGCVTWQGRQW